MSFRRVGGLGAIALATLLWLSCGEVYRPVVIPTTLTPPNPANFHAVFSINTNVAGTPGTAMQIDVSGDSEIGAANMGVNQTPTHAAILPNNSRVFVASIGSQYPGGADLVLAFTPAVDSRIATGLGTLTKFTYPNIGAGSTITCSYLPDYVTAAQNSGVYVANYGVENDPDCNLASTDSVSLLSPVLNAMTNIAYLPPGSHPVAMAETPNGLNLYVVNQGTNNVTDISPIDLSPVCPESPAPCPVAVGNTPVWAVSRVDGNRVYVLTEGDGELVPIDTVTNNVLKSQTNLSVGTGASFVYYDPILNRLYIPYPGTADNNFMDSALYVFSTTGGVDPTTGVANDTPLLLKTIPMATGANPPCPNGCSPVSITSLPDGSRFYVASYEQAPACPDPNIGATSSCLIPMLTVFDALSMTVKTPVSPTLLAPAPSLSLLTTPQFAATQYGLLPEASCQLPVWPATYAPGSTRFRMFTTAAADGSHVYVSVCDAGSIADITTATDTISTGTNAPDTLVTDLAAPFAACSGLNCQIASISAFSITNNVVTFQASNNFVPGQEVLISGLSTTAGAALDGLSLTVLANGLTASQFECNLPTPQANVPLTTDAGIASSAAVAVITGFQITSDVITFTAANTFVAGQRVAISGLSSSAGTALDGQYLTVLASGLSNTQFECNFASADVAFTPDSGTALPLPPPQSPVFLLTGQ